jgi:GntR family transcriptional regulator
LYYCLVPSSSAARDTGLDRNSHEALYAQLADILARQLAAGAYASGGRLPTEAELMRRHTISRVTVRQAMRVLQDRGLIVRRPAKGTFVRGPLVKHDLSRFGGFHDTLVAQGFQPTMRLLEYRLVSCPPAVRRKLHQKKAMRLVRQHGLGSTEVALAYSYLHPAARRVPRSDVEVTPSYRILEELLGLTIGRADLTIRAGRVDGNTARALGVRPSDPVLILERLSHAPSGEPLEHTVFYLRSDVYEFGLSLRGPVPMAGSIRSTAVAAQLARLG